MSHKEAGPRRKGTIIFTIVLAFLLAVMLLICFAPVLFLLLLSWQPYKYTQTSTSPGGEYAVAVKSTDGQWSFGSAKVKVIARGGRHWETYETEIADDGGRGGIRIFWLDEDTARVVLYGSEQTDEVVTITFSGGAPVLESEQLPYPEAVPEELRDRAVRALERVSIHDGEHAFWVGLYERGGSPDTTMVIIYDLYRQEVAQIFEDPTQAPDSVQNWGNTDGNEDGFTDFYYRSGERRIVYLWDPQTKLFVQDAAEVREVSNETTQPEKVLAQQIDIGDGVHSFWVEIVDTGERDGDFSAVQVNIYRNRTDAEPIQTFEDSYVYPFRPDSFSVEDVDFDGDMDFSFCTLDYRSFHEFSYYIWNENLEEFVQDPYGLNHLNDAQFDPEQQSVQSRRAGTLGMSGEIEYYRYLDSVLVCVRRLSWEYGRDTEKMYMVVEDGELGAVTTAYEMPLTLEKLQGGEMWSEEFSRWHDLDYHGEE